MKAKTSRRGFLKGVIAAGAAFVRVERPPRAVLAGRFAADALGVASGRQDAVGGDRPRRGARGEGMQGPLVPRVEGAAVEMARRARAPRPHAVHLCGDFRRRPQQARLHRGNRNPLIRLAEDGWWAAPTARQLRAKRAL